MGEPSPTGVIAVRPTSTVVGRPEWMNAAETAGRARLRWEPDRADHLAAHTLVRECAAALLGREPGSLRVRLCCPGCGAQDHGTPEVLGHPEVSLSLSHGRGVVAALAAQHPCGVDVETTDGVQRAVPRRALTDRERQWVSGQPVGSDLSLWVLKESLVKAGVDTLDRAARIEVVSTDGDVARRHRNLDLGLSRSAVGEVGWVLGWAVCAGTVLRPLAQVGVGLR